MAHERFYGVGEPLVQREEDTKIPAWAYLDLVNGEAVSAGSNLGSGE